MTENNPPASSMNDSPLTEQHVLDYLRSHPDFLNNHPDVLLSLIPPEQQLQGNVEDFQHFLLERMRSELTHLKENYKGLITTSRDNMSTQSQVHFAVLELMRAHDLQSLLQILTQDLLTRFDVDLVRLLIESPVADHYDVPQLEPGLSGLRYVEPGTASAAIGEQEDCRLIADIHSRDAAGVIDLFTDCEGLVSSCALLKLELPRHERQALLIFGSRNARHFHPQMAKDMLSFLGKVIAQKLEDSLIREGIDHGL